MSTHAQTNTSPTGEPTVLGPPQVGKTVPAGLGDIDDDDGLSNPGWTYQWIRVDGGTDTDISGATDSTYAVASADQGKALKVRASFADDGGTTETLTSDTTATMVAAARSCTAGALWCATLTVGPDLNSGGKAHGFCQPTSGGRCVVGYGALSDTDFTLDATDYVVGSIRWPPGTTQENGPNLHLTLDQDLPATTLDSLTLKVDGHEFALSDATRGNRINDVDHN